MKTYEVNWKSVLVFCVASFLTAACDSKDEPMGQGDVEFQITDAPSDDANIQGVFVTIVDLKVDGKSIDGFTKQTINLKSYSNGATKLLSTAQLDAKTYDNLTLILDADVDAFGNTPGCYVLGSGGERYKLKNSGSIEIALNKSWNVSANTTSTIVIDFDLRKAIRAMSDVSVQYNFVSNDNLSAAIRLFNKNKTGAVNGTYTEQANVDGDKFIVYAYKKGTFNLSQETQAQNEDGILFKNAVTSAEVKGGLTSKTFSLFFLEEGEYELHFASYNLDTANRFVFETMLSSHLDGSVSEFVTVQSGVTISISSLITGVT